MTVFRHIMLLVGALGGGFAMLGVIMYRIDKLKPDLFALRYDPLLMLEFIGLMAIILAAAALW